MEMQLSVPTLHEANDEQDMQNKHHRYHNTDITNQQTPTE
jgi:hypothetical protein